MVLPDFIGGHVQRRHCTTVSSDGSCLDLETDPRRAFVTGFSNGASMRFRIGAQLSGRVVAIAPVAGASWRPPAMVEPPVALLDITGTADPLNPLEGGMPRIGGGLELGGRAKIPVRESIAPWSAAVGGSALPTARSDSTGVFTEDRGPGRRGVPVVSMRVEGPGHHWPGGTAQLRESLVGKTSMKLDAPQRSDGFFAAQPGR